MFTYVLPVRLLRSYFWHIFRCMHPYYTQPTHARVPSQRPTVLLAVQTRQVVRRSCSRAIAATRLWGPPPAPLAHGTHLLATVRFESSVQLSCMCHLCILLASFLTSWFGLLQTHYPRLTHRCLSGIEGLCKQECEKDGGASKNIK